MKIKDVNTRPYRLKQDWSHIVMHPRCQRCGKVMPAISFSTHELVELAHDEIARLTITTCDECFRTPDPSSPIQS